MLERRTGAKFSVCLRRGWRVSSKGSHVESLETEGPKRSASLTDGMKKAMPSWVTAEVDEPVLHQLR